MANGWLSKQLRLEQKKPLVSGFIRESNIDEDLIIPTDLIKIVRWYLDEVLYWSMQNKFLKKFCDKKVGQILYSSTYNYQGIEFCNYWYPNGNSKHYADQVIFGVTLCKLPKNVKSITIYYRLQCNIFNCLWKSIHTFEQDKCNTNNCIGWNPFNMKLSKCKNKKKIDFNCYVNVIRKVYKNDNHHPQNNHNNKHELVQVDTNCENIKESLQITKYQWLLSSAEITEAQQCELGKTFYSANFGQIENYCLFIAPKGFDQNIKNNADWLDDNHLMLYLRLLRLPINIKKLTIRYHLKVSYTLKSNENGYGLGIEYKLKEQKLIDVGYGFNECTKQCLVDKIPNILLLTSLWFDIKIEIEEMIDMNQNIIPKHHWDKYGIIRNDNLSKIKSLKKRFRVI